MVRVCVWEIRGNKYCIPLCCVTQYCKRLKIYNNVGLGGDINNNGDIQYQMIACMCFGGGKT